MGDLAALQLDYATYLVPGYVVLLAAVYSFMPDRLRATREKLGLGEVLASVILALLIGLTVHRLGAVVPYASRLIHHEQMLVGIVNRFEHAQAVRATINKQLGFQPAELVDCYYYGRVLLDERAPHTAQIADRLTALALLCRNMLIAIPIGALCLSPRVCRGKRRWMSIGARVAVAIVLELFFLQGFRAYWSASVWRVLRGVLTLT